MLFPVNLLNGTDEAIGTTTQWAHWMWPYKMKKQVYFVGLDA